MSVQDPERPVPEQTGALPVLPGQAGPPAAETRRSASSVVEGLLLALTAVLAAVLAVPSLVAAARDGSVDLAAVFYPVLLVAIATLAWGRRSGA